MNPIILAGLALALCACGKREVPAAPQEPTPGKIQFSQATYTVSESSASVTIALARVEGTDGLVTVQYATQAATAHPGEQYTTTSGTLTWAAGTAAQQTFPIPIFGDSKAGGDRRFTIALSNPTGGVTLGTAAEVVIQDDEWPPPVTFVPAFPDLADFDFAVFVAAAPGDATRLYVVEKAGLIKVFANSEAATTASVFLDITADVGAHGLEMGLLGLAFDPDFATNRHLYVHYTTDDFRKVIARYTATTADSADAASKHVLLEYPGSDLHNGGWLGVGLDGKLYASSGDAGDGGTNAQSLSTLLGKIIRINLDGSIPADNPFASAAPPTRREIWAYGLRNPWRGAFDRNSGELWFGDVGDAAREELNYILPGQNYGWPFCEGTLCVPTRPPNLFAPALDYGRSEGASIIGGPVYRGSAIPVAAGLLFYSDFYGETWAVAVDGLTVVDRAPIFELSGASFGEDLNGEIYLVEPSSIYKLVQQ